jgi:hypothetical protein
MSTELKPCPFCGGRPRLTFEIYPNGPVQCANIPCRMCATWFEQDEWNIRAPDPRVKELEEFIHTWGVTLHFPTCDKLLLSGNQPCTCGYDAARKALNL